jgi:hypothetical protein
MLSLEAAKRNARKIKLPRARKRSKWNDSEQLEQRMQPTPLPQSKTKISLEGTYGKVRPTITYFPPTVIDIGDTYSGAVGGM